MSSVSAKVSNVLWNVVRNHHLIIDINVRSGRQARGLQQRIIRVLLHQSPHVVIAMQRLPRANKANMKGHTATVPAFLALLLLALFASHVDAAPFTSGQCEWLLGNRHHRPKCLHTVSQPCPSSCWATELLGPHLVLATRLRCAHQPFLCILWCAGNLYKLTDLSGKWKLRRDGGGNGSPIVAQTCCEQEVSWLWQDCQSKGLTPQPNNNCAIIV